MKLLPVNIDVHGKKAVIVGGGTVAERKCRSLLEAGAVVTVIAPEVIPELAARELQGEISVTLRCWHPGDCHDAFIVFAATDDRATNRSVAEEAQRCGILVCVSDAPLEGTFTSPSSIRRGDLLLTVSTGGKSPALSRRIRQELETLYGPEYADVVTILGDLREKQLTDRESAEYNDKICKELLEGGLCPVLKSGLREKHESFVKQADSVRMSHPMDPEESS